jgi:hypothetical protein
MVDPDPGLAAQSISFEVIAFFFILSGDFISLQTYYNDYMILPEVLTYKENLLTSNEPVQPKDSNTGALPKHYTRGVIS